MAGLACLMAPIVGRGCSSCGRFLKVEVSEVCRMSWLIDMILVDNVPFPLPPWTEPLSELESVLSWLLTNQAVFYVCHSEVSTASLSVEFILGIHFLSGSNISPCCTSGPFAVPTRLAVTVFTRVEAVESIHRTDSVSFEFLWVLAFWPSSVISDTLTGIRVMTDLSRVFPVSTSCSHTSACCSLQEPASSLTPCKPVTSAHSLQTLRLSFLPSLSFQRVKQSKHFPVVCTLPRFGLKGCCEQFDLTFRPQTHTVSRRALHLFSSVFSGVALFVSLEKFGSALTTWLLI